MSEYRLKAGPGTGHRLLATGLPDVLVIGGRRRLWVNGGCLWDRDGEDISVVDGEDLVGLAVVQDRAAVAWRSPDGFRIGTNAVDSGIEVTGARGVELGLDVAVFDHGIERRVLTLSDGCGCDIPVGARDSHPKAWTVGAGVTWLDGRHIYRFKIGGRTRLAGQISAPVSLWRSGPHGAAIFKTSAGLFGLAPQGAVHPLPELDVDSVRFSPQGTHIVAAVDNGAIQWSLAQQQTQGHLLGRLYPVGFTPEPVLLDEDVGIIRTWSGEICDQGFSPSAASIHRGRLYGPGGTAWCIQTATRLWDESPLAGDHLIATDGGVIQVHERITGLDLDGRLAFDLPLPIDPELDGVIYSAQWTDGMMYFEVEDGWVQVDFEGRRVGTCGPPDEAKAGEILHPPWVLDEATGLLARGVPRWPVIFDGAVSRPGGGVLAWSEDGVLCALSD